MLFAQSLNHGQRVVNERGYTLLCDCQQAESPYKVLSEMARNGEFTVRVSGVHNVNDATREADLEKRGSARAGPLSCYGIGLFYISRDCYIYNSAARAGHEMSDIRNPCGDWREGRYGKINSLCECLCAGRIQNQEACGEIT